MMEECGYTKHNDNNDNETYASLDTMDKGKNPRYHIPKYDWGMRKKKHNDNNDNGSDASMDTTNKGKETFPDTTSPSMMEEFLNNKHNDNN